MPRSGRTRHDQPFTTPPQSLRGISQPCQRAFPLREMNGCAARWRAPLMLVQEPTSCSANVVERGFQQERLLRLLPREHRDLGVGRQRGDACLAEIEEPSPGRA